MRIQLHRDRIRASFYILIYMISLNTPYALTEIGIAKRLFIVFRIVCTGIMMLYCLMHRMKWNRFDVAATGFGILFLISATHAGVVPGIAVAPLSVYLYNAIARVVFVWGQLLMVKMIFSMREQVCKAAVKTIFWYYLTLCMINMATQLLGLELKGKNGDFFFLGFDNEVGKYYIYAVFYCCADMIMEGKKVSRKLIFCIILTMAEGIFRKIGGLTVIGIILAGMALLLCFMPNAKIWRMRHEILLGAMISGYALILLSFTRMKVLQNFINTYLYGKVNSLQDRFDLQAIFIARWLKSPLFGWASALSGAERGDLRWFDHALHGGHTHNFFIDSLYNYGFFSFICYLFLLFLGVRQIRGKGTIPAFWGFTFLLIILRGMFENGCHSIFSVLPALYYLGNWIRKRKTVINGERLLYVQKF